MTFLPKHVISMVPALLFVFGSSAMASSVGQLTEFTSGTPAYASEVNENFSAVATAVDDNDSRITTNANTIDTTYQQLMFTKDNLDAATADLATKQVRVDGTCDPGSSIRAINLNGTVICEFDGEQTGAVSVSSSSMKTSVPDQCVLRTAIPEGYAYFASTLSTSNLCKMTTGLQLPHLATITALNCTILDNNTVNSPIIQLYRANKDGLTDAEVMFETSGVSNNSAVQPVATTTNLTTGAIDNTMYNYFLYFDNHGVNTSTVGSDMRFYNCTISYSY